MYKTNATYGILNWIELQAMKKEQIVRKNQYQNVLNEKIVLSAIRHPFIIHMEFYATNVCHIYFIMPFMVGGDLFTLISKKPAMDELNAKFYAGQMVLALEYLHMLDIIHRYNYGHLLYNVYVCFKTHINLPRQIVCSKDVI